MPFSKAWLENEPDGAIVTVSQLDNWIRDTKIAIRERLEDTLFVAGSFALAPVVNPALLGGGSGSIPFPYTHAGASNAAPGFYLSQTHAAGLGLKVKLTTDSNYAIMVADSSNTYRRWQVTGEGLTIGEAPSTAASAVTLRRPDGGVTRHWYSRLGGGDCGGEIYVSNQSTTNSGGASSQYGGASHLAATNFGGWDGGSRHSINFYYDSLGGRLYELYRPTAVAGFASDGTWAYNWSPPMTTTFGAQADTTLATSNSPYTLAVGDLPYYIGQTIVLDGGAYWMRTATIAAQRKEWPLQFAVTPNRTTDLPGIVALKLLAGTADTNRVQLFVNGALRTVQQKDFTALAAGDKVLFYT